MAVEKILLQFEADIKDLKSELADVKSQLGNVEKQTEQTGSKMTNTFKNVGKAIAGALSVQMLIQFGKESVELARKADGVKRAFDRLNQPDLLDELRKATRGTVSDLELMQNAVKASNFKIPLNQMGSMLAFASKQARDMGESVDYMVESITVGIARKSIPILDNLGISSAEIAEEMEKTGDFAEAVGNIMERSMRTTADTTLTASERVAQFRAEIENTKVALGEELLPVADASNKFILTLVKAFSAFTESSVASIEGIQVVSTAIDELGNSAQIAGDKLFAYLFDPFVKFLDESKTIQKLQAELKVLQDLLIKLPIGSKAFIDTQKEIKKVQEELRLAFGGTSGALDQLTKSKGKLDDSFKVNKKELASFILELRDLNAVLAEAIVLNGLSVESLSKVFINYEKNLQRIKGSTATFVDTTQEAVDWTQAWFDISSSAFQAVSEFSENQTTQYIDNLQKQLDAGRISQEEFEKLRRESLTKEANQNKAFAIFDIILKTAQSIMAFLEVGNIPASVAAGVTGALQLATASAAPIPAFAEGVVDLKGAGTETSDSIFARLSKGESVITAKGTRQDRALFEAANKLMLEDYIHANYVLPALKDKQNSDKAMFDDYRLYLSLQNMKINDSKNAEKIVHAIKTSNYNQRRAWA